MILNFLSMVAVVSFVDGGDKLSVTQSHQPNSATVSCLSKPTRDCAISSSFATVIAEEMGMERSKVLIALSTSMLDMGNKAQAQKILNMALEEARTVGISIALEVLLKDIIPLYVRAGDDQIAYSLIEEMSQKTAIDQVLITIATEKAKQGDMVGMVKAKARLSNPIRAEWLEMDLLAKYGGKLSDKEVANIEEKVQKYDRLDRRYRGRAVLATIKANAGYKAEADLLWDELDQMFLLISSSAQKAEFGVIKVRSMLQANVDHALVLQQLRYVQRNTARLRTGEVTQNIAYNLGPIEMALGQVTAAVNRSTEFGDLSSKVRYLQTIAKSAGQNQDGLIAEIRRAMVSIELLDGAYERDELRYHLILAAYAMGNAEFLKEITLAIEDDDNQARAVAYLAALLT